MLVVDFVGGAADLGGGGATVLCLGDVDGWDVGFGADVLAGGTLLDGATVVVLAFEGGDAVAGALGVTLLAVDLVLEVATVLGFDAAGDESDAVG